MADLAVLVERYPETATAAFRNIETALNQVLPGSDTHARYQGAEQVGLALVVGNLVTHTFNPLISSSEPSFLADNQKERPHAWVPIESASEFLAGNETRLGRFVFFALAKTENMRVTNGLSSYDPERLSITPGRVGFAGGRRLFDAFVTPSGLWEVHDHLVSGVFASEVHEVLTEAKEPRTSDEFAELFESEFARIKALHDGVEARDLNRKNLGDLLQLVDSLPF